MSKNIEKAAELQLLIQEIESMDYLDEVIKMLIERIEFDQKDWISEAEDCNDMEGKIELMRIVVLAQTRIDSLKNCLKEY